MSDQFDTVYVGDEDATTPSSSGTVGPIGQQIGQQIQGGSQPANSSQSGGLGGVGQSQQNWPFPVGSSGASTSTGNGSTTTSTGNGVSYTFTGTMGSTTILPTATTTMAIGQTAPKKKWHNIVIGGLKGVKKTKVRYVIVKEDESCLELQEQSTITPSELLGLTKFLGLLPTYTALILGEAVVEYNFHINWSDLMQSLGISRHFVPGKSHADYDDDNSEVLDVLLYDAP